MRFQVSNMQTIPITEREFTLFQKLIYDETGISLSEKKINLVRTRLHKRLKSLNLTSFTAYYEYLYNPQNHKEFFQLINAISTNVTSFFREEAQWEFLDNYLKKLEQSGTPKKLRIWSSASSTGQEPYSIAIALNEFLNTPQAWNLKILATDIDTNVLSVAQQGEYSQKDIGAMPKHLLNPNFIKNKQGTHFIVKDHLKKMILFRSFNLTRGNYEMFKRPFDIIFCRNVTIYFDAPTKLTLFENFHRLLKPGGLLFIGHSESLTRQTNLFKMIQPSIYERI